MKSILTTEVDGACVDLMVKIAANIAKADPDKLKSGITVLRLFWNMLSHLLPVRVNGGTGRVELY